MRFELLKKHINDSKKNEECIDLGAQMPAKRKRCPVCNDNNSALHETLNHKYYMECWSCDIRTQDYDTETEAIEAWNSLPREKAKGIEVDNLTPFGRGEECEHETAFIW